MNNITRPGLLRNLQVGFGLSLLILIITSVASFSSIQNLLDSSGWVDHTDSVISELNSALSALKDAETGQRGFLLTDDTVYLRPYTGARERALSQVDKIQSMTADNPVQQRNVSEFKNLILQRMDILQQTIDQKKSDNIYSLGDLKKGREYMDEARAVVQRMQAEEQRLLAIRLARVRTFSTFTPILIIVAALLSILITLFFYRKVHHDFLERTALYTELQQKDEDISRRIDIIREIAGKISGGNYQTRVTDEQKDGLGSLSGSLNKMAESLETAFNQLSDKEWLQTGLARLNEKMMGQTDMKALVSDVIRFIAEYSRSRVGAFYILDPVAQVLTLTGSYALSVQAAHQTIRPGEGLAGQAAADGKRMLVRDIPPGEWVISFAAGSIKPRTMIAFPFFREGKVKGIIELGSLEYYTDRDLEFFTSISEIIGTAVNSIETRNKLQDLLEETQAQSEELQSQHSELENLNLELEVQAEKLQVSEEELKVQQEELLQTNQELGGTEPDTRRKESPYPYPQPGHPKESRRAGALHEV